MYIDGGIGMTFFDDLATAMEANPFAQRIVITSGGGYAGPGLEAARLIRRKNLTVRVKSHCASMCVGLWAAAAARNGTGRRHRASPVAAGMRFPCGSAAQGVRIPLAIHDRT
ncbi:hypothetical protein H1235_04600 [Pseudoxanthomonas sp. NC8]|nr:hypothetical protein H1235_04600 [Pseudoxanthomonas sp. NC8]